MALTKGGSQPDKHIIPGKAVQSGSTSFKGFGSSDADAQDVYGSPSNATRMNRIDNTAKVALDASPNGISGSPNESEGFHDDGASWSSMHDSADVASGFAGHGISNAFNTPGAPGFPGIADEAYNDLPEVTATQGRDVTVPRSVKVSGNAGSNPSVKGAPGFPGLP